MLRQIIETADLSPGTAERVHVAMRGAPVSDVAICESLPAIVTLLAEREASGHAWLGFAPSDEVALRKKAAPRGVAEESAGDEDTILTVTTHRELWTILETTLEESGATTSFFMTEFPESAPTAPKEVPPGAVLVLDRQRMRLMFGRAADNEHRLERAIRQRTATPSSVLSQQVQRKLEGLFPSLAPNVSSAAERDEQLAAARAIAVRALTILTGPPGTGKSYTLVRSAIAWICAALDRDSTSSPRVRMLAPTGRAAAQMKSMLRDALDALDRDPSAKAALGEHANAGIALLREVEPSTIHAALKPRSPSGSEFKHDASTPMEGGLFIIDECSMLSSELARHLLEAIPADAKVALIGDPGQLRAVEIGSVLRDLVTRAASDSALKDCHFYLSTSRRFPPGSMIDVLARAINGFCESGRPSVESLRALLAQQKVDLAQLDSFWAISPEQEDDARQDVRVLWLDVDPDTVALRAESILTKHARHIRECLTRTDASAVLRRRVMLSARRTGPTGAETLSTRVLQRQDRRWRIGDPITVHGTPVVVLRNEPSMRLSNGDLGIICASDADESPRAHLLDGRNFDSRALPASMPAFALTVHRAQGSEWEHVTLILSGRRNRAETREAVYTAITRARKSVLIVGRLEI